MKTNKKVSALSWRLATEPNLYRKLYPNPYTLESFKVISKEFPDTSISDIARAFALAEPEEKYDRDSKQLDKDQQAGKLAKMNSRLTQYWKVHAKEFVSLPKESVYDRLCLVVFELEEKYSQSQRRDFKIKIVDLIENLHTKMSTGRSLLGILFTALILLLFFYTSQRLISGDENQTLGTETQNERKIFPIRLVIPKINVDANIQKLGVTKTGQMEVPNNPIDAGWFEMGPIPGSIGSAVLAGHFNGPANEDGVFKNLNKLIKGDKLYVVNDKGVTTSFIVREARAFDPGYADEVFGSSDGSHLNLVTCDGIWDATKKSYNKRLVVFTDLVLDK